MLTTHRIVEIEVVNPEPEVIIEPAREKPTPKKKKEE